jgi:hypothetical protein
MRFLQKSVDGGSTGFFFERNCECDVVVPTQSDADILQFIHDLCHDTLVNLWGNCTLVYLLVWWIAL